MFKQAVLAIFVRSRRWAAALLWALSLATALVAAPTSDTGHPTSSPMTTLALDSDIDFELKFKPWQEATPLASAQNKRFPFSETAPFNGLPQESGFRLVVGFCSGCHSLALVMQQNFSETRWRSTMAQMTQDHGMTPLPDSIAATMSRYLATYFGDESTK